MKNFNKITKSVALMLVMFFTFTLTACGNKTTTTTKVNETTIAANKETKSDSKTETKKAEDIKTVYPLEVKTAEKTVIIDAEPKRIVSLSPTLTEIVFAMGKGDTLVGRTDYCDFPFEATKVESVGTITKPSIEKIVALKPDVVISSMMKPEIQKQLEDAGIKVVAYKNGDSIEGSYRNMRDLSQVLNTGAKTKEIIESIEKKITEVSSKVSSAKEKVNVYYVVGYGKNGDFTAGDKTFINDLIKVSGANNVATDAEGWQYTSEKLMAKNPDLIFMGKMSKSKEGFVSEEPYNNLKAVKEGKVYEIDDNLINREGPRMGEAVEALAKLFYPELMK